MFSFKQINWAAIIVGVILTILVIAIMVNGSLVETDAKDGKYKVRLFGSKIKEDKTT